MAPTPHNAAIALLCHANGTLIEVYYDELGLTPRLAPAREFAAILVASSFRKANRFMRTVAASHSALDWALDVALPNGAAPLFFSGCITNRGIVIIGTKEPLSATAIPDDLTRIADENPDTLVPALKELSIRRDAKAKSERVVHDQLSRLNHTLVRPEGPARKRAASLEKATPAHVQLIEIAAHDLRNPISGILAASQYLIEDAARLLEEHHLTLLHSIESSSRLMLRLIEDMLEIPAIESGKLRMDFQSTDVTWLVDQSVSIVRPLAERKKVRLEVTAEGPTPYLDVDPIKMSQAINGLLTNAIKSSQAGSRIEVHVAVRGEDAVITVRDEGPGISADDLKSLFDGFQNGLSKRGLTEARTALTLANVKRIVEGHHGAISVESDLGKGSTFTLALPLSSAGQAGRHRPAHKKSAPAG
jgi:signal transduction histidine kinase